MNRPNRARNSVKDAFFPTGLWGIILLIFSLSGFLHANDAGGGAPGVGANVTLTTTSTTATLDNGVIQAVINKSSGKVTSYKLNGTQMVDPANPIYYSMDGGTSYEQPSGCVYSVVSSSPDHVEISCKRTWNATSGYKHVFDIDLHYVLRRGDTGLYAFAILDHPATYPAASVGEWRIVWKLPRDSTTFTFERAYVDAARNWEMPSYYDYQRALPTGIAEIVKLTTGVRAGLYDGKYTYSARYFDVGTWGHASNIAKKGVWFVLGGHDYFNDGPTKQDLTSSESYILMHFGRNHYDSSGINVAAGESWRKIFGPFLLYCNSTTAPTNAGDALWADAKAQVAAEEAAWPYSWLTTSDHPAASGRGTVTGQLVITDPLKPSVSAANAYVGLAAPEETDGNWQFQSKGYQYWTRADAAGNFTIPDVRPGSYTLYAFNDGAVGEYSKLAVTVSANAVNNQGVLTWVVPRSGASLVWEIGTPDRTAAEFRHGDDYHTPYLWDVYPTEFPNPLVFNIGTDNPATAFNYVHSGYPTTTAGVKTWGTWEWKLNFNLAALPATGNATLTFGIASSNYARLFLYLNDDTASFSRISPSNDGGNALLRQGIHAKYSVVRISIPVSRLRVGSNTFTLRQGVSDTSSHVMYDYIGLELPAFPPPPPSSGRTIVWKGGANGTANTWDNGTTGSFLAGATATSFGTGDAVVFNSTGSNSTAATLTGALEANSLTVNATKDYILGGPGELTGQMGLVKSGSGKLTLSSANSYAGQTVINAGTLTFGNDAANASALGTSQVTLNGGTLAMSYSSTGVAVSAPWDLDVPNGATAAFKPAWRSSLGGKLTGGGTLNYQLPSGSVRAGILGNWSGFTGRINATSTGSADFRIALDYSWQGLPSAALDLGPGITAYYAGILNSGIGTIVPFGEISGAATSSLKGGTTGGRQITYRVGGLNTDATFAGSLAEQASGLTNLVKTGSGVWTLSGTGVINGTTTVENGTLRVTGSLTHGAAAIIDVEPGGTLQVSGSITAATVHVSEGGVYLGPGTLTGSMVNDGTVISTSGTLTVNGDVTNNGLMRFSGGAGISVSGAFVNNGVLDLIDANQTLPPGFVNNGIVLTARAPASLVWTGASSAAWDTAQSANWLNGASVDVFRAGDSVTFGDSSAVTDIVLDSEVAPAAVVVDTANTVSFSGTGSITGAASLTKTGTGLLSLAAPHPMTGAVNVNGGTLQLGLAAGFPNASALSVASGATLDVSGVTNGFSIRSGQTLSGSGTVTGSLTVLGTLSPGTLGINGNLVLASTTPLAFELGTSPDVVAVSGNLTLGGQLAVTAGPGFGAGTYTLFTYTGTLTMAGGGLNFANMPAGFAYAISTGVAGQVKLFVGEAVTPFTQWQIQWFGDPNAPAAATGADPDGDGQTNNDEFIAGTVPTSAPSVSLLVWRGNGSTNLWDAGGSATFWNGARLTTFTNGNPVAFDASGTSNPSVSISGSVSPVSILVNNTATITFAGSGSLAGSGGLTKSGSGTLSINTANSFTGGVTIQSGTVALGNAAALGTGGVTLSGGTLATGTYTPTNTVSVTGDSAISGGDSGGNHGIKAVSGSGTLTLVATNVFDLEGTLSAFNGRVALSGSGSFRFNGSNGSAAADFDLGNRSLAARNGGTYNLGSLAGLSTSSLSIGTYTGGVVFSIGGNGKSTTYPGGISNGSGATSVIKTGAGTLTLGGSCGYSGATSVNSGKLLVNGALSNSPVTVSAGASLGGNGTLASTTLANGAILAPGEAGAGMLTTGPLTLNGGAVSNFELGTASDRVNVNGNLVLNGTLNITDLGGMGGSFTLFTYTGTLSGAGLTLGSTPAGSVYMLNTATPGQVILEVKPASFSAWKNVHFSAAELADSQISGPDATPAGDGVSNLMKYALGLVPKVSSTTGITLATTGGGCSIIYQRPANRLDLTYAPEVSSDLGSGTWTTIGVIHERVATGDPEVWRARVSATGHAAFLRLRVMQN